MKNRNQKKKAPAVSGITAALCIVLTVGVMTVFHACGPKEDGSWMSCHYAQMTVFFLGIAMTACSIASLFLNFGAGVFLHVLTILLAAAAAVIPGNVIRLCMMNQMQCRAVMRPAVLLLSILIIAFSAGSIAAERGYRREVTHEKQSAV